MTAKRKTKSQKKPDFTVYDADYLGEKLGMDRRKFHREIKSRIISDFQKELQDIGIRNPDIGLDNNDIIYLTDATHRKIYKTDLNINTYL